MSEYSFYIRPKAETGFAKNLPDDGIPRKFSFELPSEKISRQKRKQQGAMEDGHHEKDLHDVVDMDDRDIANFLRKLVNYVVKSLAFKTIVIVVIVLNALDIVIQTINSISVRHSYVFFVIDNIILGMFVCEIVLKWYSNFVAFWKNPWNVLDFVIVFALHIGPWLQFFSNARLVRVLRVFRAFKTLRTFTSVAGISLVVETIMKSLADMVNITILLCIFTLVLSVVGVKLFGRLVPQYFGDPLQCMFSIFVCFTQDGWVDIFNTFAPFVATDLVTYISACLFFMVTILTAAFIIANLIVAVVTTNLELVTKELKEEQRSTRNAFFALTTKTLREKSQVEDKEEEEEADAKITLVMLDKVLENLFQSKLTRFSTEENEVIRNQRSLYKTDLSHISLEKLENYFLLLIAFEHNLKEHHRLRKILNQTTKITKILNDKSDPNVNDLESRLRRDSLSVLSFMDVTEKMKEEMTESPRWSKNTTDI